MAKKILHISDYHLGISKKRLEEVYGVQKIDNNKKFLKAIKFCKKEKIDLIICSGDLFDMPFPRRRDLSFVFNKIKNLDVPFIIIPGNHDSATNESFWFKYKFPKNVKVIMNLGEDETYEDGELKILGNRYEKEYKNLEKRTLKKSSKIKIGVFHGLISSDKNLKRFAKKEGGLSKNFIEKLGMDYFALGDHHNFLRLNKKIIYPGAPCKELKNNEGNIGVLIEIKDKKISCQKVY